MRPQMPVRTPVVGVSGSEFYIDKIENAMADTALGDNLIGKFSYPFHRSLQHDGLDALIVIQMGMHCGDRQLMMSMLNAGQAFRQFSLVMVVHVR